MSTISVYAFLDESAEDGEYDEYTTQDYREAEEYAKANECAVIELEYEFSDSSLVVDYRPGHAKDGTLIEEALTAD